MRETSAEKDRRNMTNTETHDTAANTAAPGAPVAPAPAPAKKGASKKKGAPRSPKAAARRKAKPAPKAKVKAKAARAKQAGAPRAESKGARILALTRRAQGPLWLSRANWSSSVCGTLLAYPQVAKSRAIA